MADLLCKTAKIVALTMSSRMAHPLLPPQRTAQTPSGINVAAQGTAERIGRLHGKHGGGCDQKISFYFDFYCQLFFYSATLELSTVAKP
jgi:hypothetical protein